jgi:tripartite-type tricarboxylate transporter receptor subunit TctC
VLAPISNPKLGYDPKRDLTNIGYVAGSPIVLSVSANGSIKTLQDFIEQGRAGKALTYSSSGVGSSGQLVAEDFAKKAGIKIEHVPYKGASQGLTDWPAATSCFSAQTMSSTAALVRGGQLRAIAHSNATRMPDFPDVPTLKESGYDVVATTWFSISGPANLPKDITEKVNREIARAVSNPGRAGAAATGWHDCSHHVGGRAVELHRRRDRTLAAGARSAWTDREINIHRGTT